ncbi:MAG: hypothetical protein NTY48_06990 [Candidatus Diapherotrites archaeon]|nr:hypothetical protein [Candidatus Diapherotrites archaeon]
MSENISSNEQNSKSIQSTEQSPKNISLTEQNPKITPLIEQNHKNIQSTEQNSKNIPLTKQNSSIIQLTEQQFETPFTVEEKEKRGLVKKLSPQEMILQKVPFAAEKHLLDYFESIQKRTLSVFNAAQAARNKGLDLVDSVEVIPAMDLADRVESIIGLFGLAKRFREIFNESKDRRKAYFQLFREILDQKWWKIPSEQQRVETGIKACLLIETEGVVVAPLDGVPKVEINSNQDGTKYIDIYFAGPIRAAGGSSTVIPLILGDFARTHLGLDRYKPTQDEIERYVEEIGIYQTDVISRQYIMSDEEIRIIITGCPVCINGVQTEEVEVLVHRDIPQVKGNRIRGGMGLVVSEGLALKALWVMKTAKDLGLNWDFLEKIVKVEKTQTKIEIKPNKAYLDRLAAGRPILAYPSTWGGFRLRYGRGRNTGIMAKAINPSTMILLDEFIAVGTHGRIERPGKATQFFPCNTIDGPIVLLKDGEVRRVNTKEEAELLKASVEKIIYIGDLLATFGDFKKSAHPLIPVGYCEEWWVLDLKKAVEITKNNEKLKELGLEYLLSSNISDLRKISEDTALLLSKEFNIPLHSNFLHFYRALNLKEIIMLKEFLSTGLFETTVSENKKFEGNSPEIKTSNLILKIENKPEEKKLLERIGVPHKISAGKIIISDFAKSLLMTFGLEASADLKVIVTLRENGVTSVQTQTESLADEWVGRNRRSLEK